MPPSLPPKADHEQALIERIAGFKHDPLGFVRFAFPWGEPGELLHEAGPREWQVEYLDAIGRALRNGATVHQAILMARASGHGIGKSALVAFLVLWALSTRAGTKCVVTANTEPQLRTKTWPEIAKWHRLMINSHWFTFAATSVHSTDKRHEKTWRADAITWSVQNTEAFAGLHNVGKRILVVMDEASAIDDVVWQVTEGALTDEGTEIIWAAFGNPTRNTGRFRECFGRLAHRWNHRQIDSRTVPGTNKVQIDKWQADYGEDSDFFRVRVKGEFPRAGSAQLISSEVVAQARTREAVSILGDPLVMGVDVARFGRDEATIYFRRGMDARTIPPQHYRGLGTMEFVGRIVSAIREHKPDHVFIDETGVGAGVVDRVQQMGYQVVGVNNSGSPDGKVGEELVKNKGAECWVRARDWLKRGGAIGDDVELGAQLEGREFFYDRNNAIQLESKDDMAERGLSSPDRADGLCLTFSYEVAPTTGRREAGKAITDYDPLADAGGNHSTTSMANTSWDPLS